MSLTNTFENHHHGMYRGGFVAALKEMIPAAVNADIEDMVANGGSVKIIINNRRNEPIINCTYSFEYGNCDGVWCKELSDVEYIKGYCGREHEIKQRMEDIRGDINFTMKRLTERLHYMPREKAENQKDTFPELHAMVDAIKDLYCDLADEEFALDEYKKINPKKD